MIYVTADDFGIGFETSRGIVAAHLAGAVDATSVMTSTGDHLERSLPLLAEAPGLKLGLHITLTSLAGRALVATRASGLVSTDGDFHSLPRLYLLCGLRRVSRTAVSDEISAQVDRFRRVVGREPDHIDGHHHSHQLPIVREVVAELIAGGTLPSKVRNTVPARGTRSAGGAGLRRGIIAHLGKRSRPLFAGVGAYMPDGFFGVLSEQMLRADNPWADYLRALDSGVNERLELGVHPGFDDPTLIGRDSYLLERTLELQALLQLGTRVKQLLPALARYGWGR